MSVINPTQALAPPSSLAKLLPSPQDRRGHPEAPPSPTCPCPDWLPSLGSQVPPPPSPAPPHRQPLNGERAGLRAPIPPSTTPLPLPPVISTRAKPHLYPESPHNFVSGLDPPPTSPPMTRRPSPSVFLRASPIPRIKRLLLSATLLCPAFPSPRMVAPPGLGVRRGLWGWGEHVGPCRWTRHQLGCLCSGRGGKRQPCPLCSEFRLTLCGVLGLHAGRNSLLP